MSCPDFYEVYICETNTEIDLSKMTKIFSGFAANPWTQRSVELEAAEYAGKTVYIAFRHQSEDCYFLEIDNFAVGAEAPAHTHTVTFDANGGSVTPASAETGTDGKLDTLPTPTHSGSYSFDGWYTLASGGTKVDTNTVFTAAATIYAHWSWNFDFRDLPAGGVTNITVPVGDYYTGEAARAAFILYWGENIKTDGDFVLIDYFNTYDNDYHMSEVIVENDVISAKQSGFSDLSTILSNINDPNSIDDWWINGTYTADTAVTEYDVWVGDIQVTSDNKDNICGDEGAQAVFDPETSTLTLNNYRGDRILAEMSLNIVLANDSKNEIYANSASGIQTFGSCTISGNGTLTINAVEYGIRSGGGITISSDDVTITAHESGLWAATDVVLSGNGAVSVTSENGKAVLIDNSGCSLLLNGTGSPISLTSSDEYTPAVWNRIDETSPVGGTNFTKYTETGAPDEQSVVYTLGTPVTYTATFDPNGGSVTPTSATTGANGKLATLPTPTRSGSYSFDGWYTAAIGGTKVTVDKVYTADTTIYAKWTYNTPAPSGDSTPTVTVPVTGDENSVKVSATVSGSTATIEDIKDADLAKVTGGESVEIDLTGLKKDVDTAKIPTATVEKIGEQAGMSVKLTTATVSFDKTATQEISDQAKGNTVELVVDGIKEVSLNAVQKEAVQKLDTALIIDAYLVSGGTKLCTEGNGGFNGGKATVILPYELKSGSTAANYSVYYVAEDGTLEKLNAKYDSLHRKKHLMCSPAWRLLRNNRPLRKEELGERHRVNVLAVFVDAHVAAGNLVNQHDAAIGRIAVLKLDVIKDKALFLEIVGNDSGNFLRHILNIFILLFTHHAERNECIFGNERISLFVVFEGRFHVGGKIGAFFDILAITTQKASDRLVAADDLKAVTEYLCRKNLHCCVEKIGGNIMSLDSRGIDFLKEIDAHAKVDITNAVNGETNSVFARIKHTVLAGAVIFEFKHVVAVFKRINVLCLASVNEFHDNSSILFFILSDTFLSVLRPLLVRRFFPLLEPSQVSEPILHPQRRESQPRAMLHSVHHRLQQWQREFRLASSPWKAVHPYRRGFRFYTECQ